MTDLKIIDWNICGLAAEGQARKAEATEGRASDLAQNVWWEEGEQELLGVDRLHDARDVYRDYLESRGGLAGRPTDEPLATSFERHGGAGVRVACRYDAIYATPEWDVREASYHYKEGRDAGSDHGYVRATLTMPEGGPPR
jgi:hypothetical protein